MSTVAGGTEVKPSGVVPVPTVPKPAKRRRLRPATTLKYVFLTALALFIWGGEVLRDFSFAMLMGVGFGTYSSVISINGHGNFATVRTEHYNPEIRGVYQAPLFLGAASRGAAGAVIHATIESAPPSAVA